MLTTLRNAWKIPELRRKILFTLLIILLYRIGNVIPVPFVNVESMSQMFDAELSGTILGLFNMMSGNAFSMATIFALSIQPYINASIIIQLLTIAIPALERLSKEGGEEGKKKITKITRITTVALGLLMGFAYYVMLTNYNGAYNNLLLTETGVLPAIVIILTFTAGSTLVMWLGEQITEHGIGNGISMILFANIIARIPGGIIAPIWNDLLWSKWYWALALVVGMLAIIVFIIYVSQAERRIPVQYAKRVVGRKVYGGQNTHLPIKVNMSGVMPIIFAGSILSIPPTIQMFIPSAKLADSKFWTGFFKVFTSTHWAYGIIYFILIIAFAYFYSSIQYNPIEMSQNIAKNGGMIPGIRTGRPTSDYIARIISRITLLGALLLSVVAIFPIVFSQLTTLILTKTTIYADGMNVSLGGTSIIILVGVALETVKQLESQMMMRHYKGFLD